MEKTKKLVTILFLVLILINGCGKKDNPNFSEIIILDQDITLNQTKCSERNLEDKVIMIESKWCGHCSKVRPLLEEISEEKGVDITFLNLGRDHEEIVSYGIDVKYTPTVLINCNVVIGARSKEYYEDVIGNE